MVYSSSDFSTNDTSLAAWLQINGVKLNCCDNTTYPAVFYFCENQELRELVSVFNSGIANGNILAFLRAYKNMIALVKENRNVH